MGGFALKFSKIFTSFDVETIGVFSKLYILYRPKNKHDKSEQGPDLALFLEVHFLENLALIKGPKPEGKKPLKTVTTVTSTK